MYGREVRVSLQLAKEVNSYPFQWQNTFQTCMTGYTVWLKAKVKEKYKELHYRKSTSRRLDQVTEDDPYYIPRTEELLDKMKSARYITKLRGFYQVPLREQDKKKTAFTSPLIRRMPFGLKNAPATLQRLVNSLFDGMADRVETYIDDIAVYSQTWEQHLQNLKKVVSLLQSAGLTLGTDKCTLGTDSCEFQDHVAGSGRLKQAENLPGHRLSQMLEHG